MYVLFGLYVLRYMYVCIYIILRFFLANKIEIEIESILIPFISEHERIATANSSTAMINK